MRILELTVRNFRGYGPSVEPIDLSGDLNVLYGPNGFGKTSTAEAIEWLFYGTTKRRQRGEGFSRAEYANTFANAHGHMPTEVILKVRIGDRDIVLSRRLGFKETSSTYVDGRSASFASIGIHTSEAYYPVVAQHGLQTFVHSKPKERRDAICAALGLDELTSFKSTLESARGSLQRTPPLPITLARRRLVEIAAGLSDLPGLGELASRWAASPASVNRRSDESALVTATARLVAEAPSGVEDASLKLRDARLQMSKSIFDVSPIEPVAGIAQLIQTAIESLADLADRLQAVDDALSRLAGASAAAYSAGLLEFWKEGLRLASGPDSCPMCEAKTLTQNKRAELAGRIEEAGAILQAHADLGAALEAWQEGIAPAGHAIVALGLKGLDPSSLAALSDLLEGHDHLPTFLGCHDRLLASRVALGETLRASRAIGTQTRSRSAVAGELPALIEERLACRNLLRSRTETFFDDLAHFLKAWDAIKEAVGLHIAANANIFRIDALMAALDARSELALLERYASVLEGTQDLVRKVETRAQERQGSLLKSRGQDVQTLYKLLNPGIAVGFESMEPANDAMKLHATSFGVRMPAAANLSECQLNCLGLAVWLMRATTSASPFGFILLDDPVQAMDDDHAEAFIGQVVPHLLDKENKQVVVFSHVCGVTDKLRQLNLHRDLRHYHIENFEAGGPLIVRQLRLQRMLAEIKGAASGNEDNRKYAVDRLRVLIEQFVRELHLRKLGRAPPPNFDTANSGQLADLFRSIPDTEPDEHARLRDTIRFCDPAHHTQAGYAAPLKSNIQPHIDRVSDFMKRYGLI